MFHRRIRLLALCSVIVFGIVVGADAGQRRRARRMAYVNYQSQSAPGRPATPDAKKTDPSICPMYPWMNHGSYCSWYSIPCSGGTPGTPLNYDGTCGAGPQSPCSCNIPRTLVEPRVIAEGTINEKLKDGYSWEAGQSLEFPVGVRPTGAVRIRNKGNKLVTVEFTVQTNADNIALVEVPETGETVYVQLVKATLVPKEPLSVDLDEDVAKSLRIEPKPPFFVGHEVRQQAGTVDPENVTVLEGTSRILKVTYKGEDYTVILRALLPNVHP